MKTKYLYNIWCCLRVHVFQTLTSVPSPAPCVSMCAWITQGDTPAPAPMDTSCREQECARVLSWLLSEIWAPSHSSTPNWSQPNNRPLPLTIQGPISQSVIQKYRVEHWRTLNLPGMEMILVLRNTMEILHQPEETSHPRRTCYMTELSCMGQMTGFVEVKGINLIFSSSIFS